MQPNFTELRERLRMQKQLFEEDDFGGRVARWEDHKSVWAKVDFSSAKNIKSSSLKGGNKEALERKKSLYKIVMRADKTLPDYSQFIRETHTLRVITDPVYNGDYMTLFAYQL